MFTPLTEKPVPVTPTFEMVTLALPLLVSATLSELLLPSLTLPKLKFVVLNPNTLVEATPVPVRAMARGELGALLTSVIDPETAPAEVGAKTALNAAVVPAAIVTGALMPEMLNPVPVTLTDETVRVAEPPFDSVIVCELLVPVDTLPKAALDGVAEICACVAVPLRAMVSGEFGALLTIEIVPVALPPVVGANCAVKEVPCPAANVFGVASPLRLNPAPEVVAWEIVKLAEPLFVTVTVCDPVPPVATEPKATTEGLAPICPCTPVPDSETAAGEPGALLTIETLPVAAPATVGAKVALNEALAPALIVIGSEAPLTLYPGPDGFNCVTVSVAFPGLDSETVCEVLLPTAAFPKLRLAGFTVSWGCDATPTPVRLTISGEFGELLTIEMLPLALPAVAGANFAVKDAVCPAPRVTGVASPLVLKPVPDTLACEIEILAEPELVNVTADEPLAPTITLPKVTLNGFAVRLPCVPEPLRGIDSMELVALLVIVMPPEALPEAVGAKLAVKLTAWLAASVTGALSPVTLKPAPVTATAEIVAVAFPEFVSVTVCWPLLPTATPPNDTLAGLAPSVELVATPFPERTSVWGEFGALSVKVILPAAAPVAVGANCAANVSVWPAERVFGSARPDIPNAVPVTVARLMTTFEFPVFVSVTFCELLCPTVMLPKLREAGEIERPACAPVPLNEIARGEFDASLVTAIVPLVAPDTVGAN